MRNLTVTSTSVQQQQQQPPSYQHDTIKLQNQHQHHQQQKDPTTRLIYYSWCRLALPVVVLFLLLFVSSLSLISSSRLQAIFSNDRTLPNSKELMIEQSITTQNTLKLDDHTATFGEQEHQNNRIVRQMLQLLQDQINGTIYFPCNSNHADDYNASSLNSNDDLLYNEMATGWVKRGREPLQQQQQKQQQQQQQEQLDFLDRSICCCNNNSCIQQPIGIVIVQVANEVDVQIIIPTLVTLDVQYNIPFRIRSGGHHKLGYSSLLDLSTTTTKTSRKSNRADDGNGIIVSLSLLNHIQMIPSSSMISATATSKTVATSTTEMSTYHHHHLSIHESPKSLLLYHAVIRIGPAVLVHDILQQVTRTYNYGGVIGYCSTVGEAGFILGGGYGLQSRLYGLGIDNVVSFRIVLYNGTIITTSPTTHASLHWALLGAGGGSYGIVTEIEYRVHPVCDTIHLLQLRFIDNNNDNTSSLLAYFLYHIGHMESNLPKNMVLMYDQMSTINLLWSGRNHSDVQDGDTYMYHLVQTIIEHVIGTNQSISDCIEIKQETVSWVNTFSGPNIQHPATKSSQTNTTADGNDDYSWANSVWAAACWNGFLLPENNTLEIWNNIIHALDVGLKGSYPYLLPDVELWGGSIHDYPSNATAFPYRSAIYNVGVLLLIPTNEPNASAIFEMESNKINDWWYNNIDQYLSGSYVNYPMVSLLNRNNNDMYHYAKVQWGENLSRLVKVKQEYDPNNVFRFPMSVPVQLHKQL